MIAVFGGNCDHAKSWSVIPALAGIHVETSPFLSLSLRSLSLSLALSLSLSPSLRGALPFQVKPRQHRRNLHLGFRRPRRWWWPPWPGAFYGHPDSGLSGVRGVCGVHRRLRRAKRAWRAWRCIHCTGGSGCSGGRSSCTSRSSRCVMQVQRVLRYEWLRKYRIVAAFGRLVLLHCRSPGRLSQFTVGFPIRHLTSSSNKGSSLSSTVWCSRTATSSETLFLMFIHKSEGSPWQSSNISESFIIIIRFCTIQPVLRHKELQTL